MIMMADYINDRDAAWGFGNAVLYRMCLHDAPSHRDKDEIAGKLWLIGRSYAASPERGAGEASDEQDPDFFRFLAESLRWPEIDAALEDLSGACAFSTATLAPVLQTHSLLVELIYDRTQMRLPTNKLPRFHTSFASKYLHFHRPDHFPIFDSYVNDAITREYPRFRHVSALGVDARYSRFCSLILRYRGEHAEVGTLRSLDRKLYEKQRAYKAAQRRSDPLAT